MKKFLLMFLAVLTCNLFADIDVQNQYKELTLQNGKVYEIFCKKGTGATTIVFPSKITRLAGTNIGRDATKDYMINIQANGSSFDIVCINEKSEATLNVMYNSQMYILLLKFQEAEAYSAVVFKGKNAKISKSYPNKQPKVSDARLLSMLDLSKTYSIVAEHQAQLLADTTREVKNIVYDFDEFQIKLLDVMRFGKEDTLVFKVQLINPQIYPIKYDPYSFSVQVGTTLYPVSAVSASGIMNPDTTSYAFFAITGHPNGARNNLSLDNKFILAVTTQRMVDKMQAPVDEPINSEAEVK